MYTLIEKLKRNPVLFLTVVAGVVALTLPTAVAVPVGAVCGLVARALVTPNDTVTEIAADAYYKGEGGN